MEQEYALRMREAKEYALRSLTCREQTKYQLSEKLRRRDYSPEIIREVMDYLKEYNYINDDRFLEQYIAGHCHRMNRTQLERKLYSYGFRQLRLDDYLENIGYDEESILSSQLSSYIRKKDLTDDLNDPMIRKKVISHFVNKGFSYRTVLHVLQETT